MRNHPTARKTKKTLVGFEFLRTVRIDQKRNFLSHRIQGGACSRVIPDSVALAFVLILEDCIIKPVVLKRVFGLPFPIPDDACLHAHKIPFVISFRAQRPAYKSDPRYNKKNGKEDRYSVNFFLFQSLSPKDLLMFLRARSRMLRARKSQTDITKISFQSRSSDFIFLIPRQIFCSAARSLLPRLLRTVFLFP